MALAVFPNRHFSNFENSGFFRKQLGRFSVLGAIFDFCDYSWLFKRLFGHFTLFGLALFRKGRFVLLRVIWWFFCSSCLSSDFSCVVVTKTTDSVPPTGDDMDSSLNQSVSTPKRGFLRPLWPNPKASLTSCAQLLVAGRTLSKSVLPTQANCWPTNQTTQIRC